VNMNNRSYNIFNLRLYIDALRRMSVPGFIFTGIMLLISVIAPIRRYYSVVEANGEKYVSILSSFAYMPVVFVFLAPILVFMTFEFLNRRSTSDYYHSFPQKRICIFNSLFSAVMTWIIAIILLCYICSVIMYLIFSDTLVLDFGVYTLFMLCMFAAAFLVSAACVLACSITGTLLANVCVTGIILFLPRMIIGSFENIIQYSSVLLWNDSMFLLDSKYNLVVSSVHRVLGTHSFGGYIDVINIVYTVILALIFTGLAAYLFTRRKSETAGMASVNRALQCIIRIAVAMPACIVGIQYVFDMINSRFNSVSAGDVINMLLCYIIALVMLFLYELISTRKLKNMVKAIPSAVILLVLNVVIIAGLVITFNAQINYLPSEDSVEYVSSDSIISGDVYSSYFMDRMGDYHITNKEAISIILQALDNTIDGERKRIESGIDTIGNEEGYEADIDTSYGLTTVRIKSGMFEKTRQIYLTKSEKSRLYEILSKDENIKNVYRELPEYDRTPMTVDMIDADRDLSAEQYIELYKSLTSEVKDIKLEDWINALKGNTASFVNIMMFVNGGDSLLDLPVTVATPKTLELAINYINAAVPKEKLEEVRDIAENVTAKELNGNQGTGEANDKINDGQNFHIYINRYNAADRNFETLVEYNTDGAEYGDETVLHEMSDKVLLGSNVVQSAVAEYGRKYSFGDAATQDIYMISYNIERRKETGYGTDYIEDCGSYYVIDLNW